MAIQYAYHLQIHYTNIGFCVFYITKRCNLYSVLYYYSALNNSGGFSAHYQELIKLYVQPWGLSCFPVVYRWCG